MEVMKNIIDIKFMKQAVVNVAYIRYGVGTRFLPKAGEKRQERIAKAGREEV